MTRSLHHPFPAKLDLASAEEMRARYRAGESPRSLAAAYGVAVSSAYDVLRQRAHSPKLVIPLSSDVLQTILEGSAAEGTSPEAFVAGLVARALNGRNPQ